MGRQKSTPARTVTAEQALRIVKMFPRMPKRLPRESDSSYEKRCKAAVRAKAQAMRKKYPKASVFADEEGRGSYLYDPDQLKALVKEKRTKLVRVR